MPVLRGRLESAMAAAAQLPWAELVTKVRNGPPWWSPMRHAEGLSNLVEFVVHREDVARAQLSDHDTRGEDRNQQTLQVIWQRLRTTAPLMFRHDAVELVAPGFGTWRRGGAKTATVKVTGSPVEIALLATGRPNACTVEGQSQAVTTFKQRRRAI